ncbi:MAG: hypothetical protein ACRDHP_17130, partial [Ktedonobacterales bacterium]
PTIRRETNRSFKEPHPLLLENFTPCPLSLRGEGRYEEPHPWPRGRGRQRPYTREGEEELA